MTNTQHNPDNCTACTICVAHCPVATATMKFRGPKLTGPAYERFRLLGFGDEASLEYCSNCKNCDISCPSGVPVATFNMLARAAYCKQHTPPLRDWLMGHSGVIGSIASLLPAWLLNLGMKNPISRFAMDLIGVDKRAPLPSFASLAQRRAVRRKKSPDPNGKNVVLFPGCFISYYEPHVGLDLIRLLEKAGYTVIVPENFVCCGLPLVANGYADDALDRARANSMELARWARAGVPVITACPSCTLMLTQEYHDLFPREEQLGLYADSVYDACEFLMERVHSGELVLDNAAPPQKHLAYHAPCHLRAQGIGRSGLDLLRMIPGLQVDDMDAGCCGISGSYGFKKDKYEIGMQVGAPLFKALKDSKAPLTVSECGTCRVQMRHGSRLPAAHPLSVLLHSIERKPLP